MRRAISITFASAGILLAANSFWLLFVPSATFGMPGAAAGPLLGICLMLLALSGTFLAVSVKLWAKREKFETES